MASSLAIGGGAWLAKIERETPPPYQTGSFYDNGNSRPDSGYIAVSGRLLGDDMMGGTFLSVECSQSRMRCLVIDVQALGPQKTIFVSSSDFRISSWSAELVVADSEAMPTQCNSVTLNIARKAKRATYTRTPQPLADKESCRVFASKAFTWTIDAKPLT